MYLKSVLDYLLDFTDENYVETMEFLKNADFTNVAVVSQAKTFFDMKGRRDYQTVQNGGEIIVGEKTAALYEFLVDKIVNAMEQNDCYRLFSRLLLTKMLYFDEKILDLFASCLDADDRVEIAYRRIKTISDWDPDFEKKYAIKVAHVTAFCQISRKKKVYKVEKPSELIEGILGFETIAKNDDYEKRLVTVKTFIEKPGQAHRLIKKMDTGFKALTIFVSGGEKFKECRSAEFDDFMKKSIKEFNDPKYVQLLLSRGCYIWDQEKLAFLASQLSEHDLNVVFAAKVQDLNMDSAPGTRAEAFKIASALIPMIESQYLALVAQKFYEFGRRFSLSRDDLIIQLANLINDYFKTCHFE